MSPIVTAILFGIPLGALAGVLAGLFGIGGGLILVTALVWLLPGLGIPTPHLMHVALATSLGAIVLTALASAKAHRRRGSILWPSVLRLLPGLLIGGVLGAQIAGHLSGRWLQWGVIGFCLVAAWEMWRPKAQASAADPDQSPTQFVLVPAGLVIGLISALVGIGGGSMTVPLLIHLGARPVRAVGTSAACGLPIALAAATGFMWTKAPIVNPLPEAMIGFVHVPMALTLGLTSVLFAPLGARLAHALPGASLRRGFAVLLVLVAGLTWYRAQMLHAG